MKRLLIIGAGGFGREVFAWAQAQANAQRGWRVHGFLDANPQALAGTGVEAPILGDPANYTPQAEDCFVGAIGDSATRLRLAEDLRERGARFVNVIHPAAVVGPACRLGVGCVLCPGAVISTNVTLGNHVVLNMGATVGHDAALGDGCTLSPHADVTGCVRLGRGVLLGSHASVLPGVAVGDFAVVGAGSVAVRAVPPRVTVMGVPAKAILWPREGTEEV